MPRNSTNKQMAVLSFIHKQVDAHGYPPTAREICGDPGSAGPWGSLPRQRSTATSTA